MAGIIEATILNGRFDALAAFFYGDIGKADDIEIAALTRADVDFDFDEIGIDAEDSGAVRFEEHGKGKSSCLAKLQFCQAKDNAKRTSSPDKLGGTAQGMEDLPARCCNLKNFREFALRSGILAPFESGVFLRG